MILFRADGNLTVGSDHIMRCLSLSDGFLGIGQNAVFIMADNYLQNVIRQRGHECIALHTKYNRMEDKLPVLLPVLKRIQPHCVLMDSYFVTPDYMFAVK